MLFFDAAQRLERQQRRGNIADGSAAHHGGEFLKTRMTQLKD